LLLVLLILLLLLLLSLVLLRLPSVMLTELTVSGGLGGLNLGGGLSVAVLHVVLMRMGGCDGALDVLDVACSVDVAALDVACSVAYRWIIWLVLMSLVLLLPLELLALVLLSLVLLLSAFPPSSKPLLLMLLALVWDSYLAHPRIGACCFPFRDEQVNRTSVPACLSIKPCRSLGRIKQPDTPIVRTCNT
jgi:hypothetical protein